MTASAPRKTRNSRQSKLKRTPARHASPLPPRKPSSAGKMCPRIHAEFGEKVFRKPCYGKRFENIEKRGKNADPFAHGYNGVRRPRVLRTLCSDVKALYPCDNIRRIDAPDNISAQHAQQFFHGLHLSNVLSWTFYHVHDGMSRCP